MNQGPDRYDSGAFGVVELNHIGSISPTRSKRSLSKSKSPNRQSEQKSVNIGDRVSKLESMVRTIQKGSVSNQ